MRTARQVTAAPLAAGLRRLVRGEAAGPASALRRPWLPVASIVAVCVATVPIHLWLTRGGAFFGEEVAFAARYRTLASGMGTIWAGWFDPLMRLTYNLTFATVGLDSYLPMRLFTLAANIVLALAVYWYCSDVGRPRAGVLLGLFLLLFGPAVHSLLVPLNSVNAISMATLPAGLVLLRRGRRSSDLGAAGLLLLATGFGAPGMLQVCAALVVWLVVGEGLRAWRRALLVLAPVGVYLVAIATLPGGGRLSYGPSIPYLDNLLHTPALLVQGAAGTAGAIAGVYRFAGLGRPDFGPALAALAAVAIVWRFRTLAPESRRRVVALLAAMVIGWVMLALSRGEDGLIDQSRYLLFGTVPALLIAVELTSNVSLRPRLVLGAALLVATLSNVGVLRDFAAALRHQVGIERAELAALELQIDRAPAAYKPDANPVTPGLLFLTAGEWRETRERIGSFAIRPDELPRATADARAGADRILRELASVSVAGARAPADRPDCTRGAGTDQELTLRSGGLTLAAGQAAPVTVYLRRFGDGYAAQPDVTLQPGEARSLRPVPDASPVPWTARVSGPFLAC